MKVKQAIKIIFITLAIAPKMQAQSPAFYHLSTAEGLSDNYVTSAARDRNGILWVGTTEGLNSFDGNRITTFHKYKYPGMEDNYIEEIIVDDDNNVWVQTTKQQLLVLDKDRRFQKISFPALEAGKYPSHFFLTSSKGIIAIKDKQHFSRWNSRTGSMEKLDFAADSVLPATIRFMFRMDGDKIGFYGNDKIVVLDYHDMSVLLNLPFPELAGIAGINKDEFLAYPLDGHVFYRFSIVQKKTVAQYENLADQYGKPIEGNLRNIARISEKQFAITSRFSGLYLLDLEKKKLEHWVHDPLDRRSLGGNNTHRIFYDSSGYLMITTQTSGLHYYNMKQQQAGSKPYFINEKKEVFDGFIKCILTRNDGTVWLGAQDRLIKWNRQTDQTVFVPCYLADGTNISREETIRTLNFFDDNLWVGTTRYGVLILNRQLKTIAQLSDSMPGKKTGLPSGWINAVCTDRNDHYWIGTIRGTCMVEKGTLKVHDFKSHPLLAPISKLNCLALCCDRAGIMWIATTQGVWRYDEINKSLTNYTTEKGLVHNMTLAINEDNLGNTYFATAGGLSILSKEGTITNYNRSNGLRNDRCEGILRDENGFIWIGNLNCILRYDPVNKKFTVYEEGIGFSHAGFRMRSSYKSSEGEMFWGSDKGLTYFFPQQMSRVLLPLHPHINTVEADNERWQFTGRSQVRFPYNTSSFIFSYSSGELTGDKKIHLLCRLAGFEKEWKTTGTVGLAAYGRLPPGHYSFKMKASRDGILWYEAPYPIDIIISRPWWQQAWFRLLLVFTVAGIAWLIYSNLRKRRRNKMESMQFSLKMAESKFSNLRLQMNPHFLFNSLSSIQHLIVSQQTNRAYKYLTVFSNFLRSLLNYAEKNFIPLDEELKILQMYIELESLRFDQSFSWEIQTDEHLVNDEVLVPTLMIQPFVENAIWHGLLHKEGDKKLLIHFQNSSEEYLTCTVEDNGIGREEAGRIRENNLSSKVHISKGMGIIRERLQLLEEKTGKPARLEVVDLHNNEQAATGTKIIITIPYYNPEET